MAVIQDLPPELLRRILELTVDHHLLMSTPQSPCRTSRVARARRSLSQELLLRAASIQTFINARHASKLHILAGSTLLEVVLSSGQSQSVLGFLKEHRVAVCWLRLWSSADFDDLDMRVFDLELLTGEAMPHLYLGASAYSSFVMQA